MRIVLFEPQIPQNTGNIVRTCSVTGADLFLVPPLGFSTSSRMLKRAGLDYWDEVNITQIDHFEEYLDNLKTPFYFLSSKGKKTYSDVSFSEDVTLIFGSETAGLPQWIHEKYQEHFLTIPMIPGKRSLNLSNSVSLVLYEALRQNEFKLCK